jgi:signal transduction histidine kinase
MPDRSTTTATRAASPADAPPPAQELEIMRSMFAATIHNIGNIVAVANLSVKELEQANGGHSSPLLDMILDEMLPTLAAQVASGDGQRFLADHPQGREYLAAIRDLLQHQRKTILDQRAAFEALGAKLASISQIIALQQQLMVGMGIEENVPLDQLVDDALKMMGASATRRGIDVVRHFTPTPQVHVDPSTMTQVLINLLKNAIEAFDLVTDDRRKVIEIATLTAERDGRPHVQCIIADNGPGMTSDTLARAFDYGYSTKQKGRGERGVGLHFCRMTVERMGGQIDLASTLGQGSRFTLWLKPATPPTA